MNTVHISSSTPTDQLVTPTYNMRLKYIEMPDGSFHLYERLYSSSDVFRSEHDVSFEINNHTPKTSDTPKDPCANLKRARSRAKSKFTDYAVATFELDCFCTFTVADTELRYSHKDCLKKVLKWFENRVLRNGLIYLCVPELHKDGALHFHALCNASALKLTDSGTVLIPERKKPVKIATAKRLHPNSDEWKTVFNVADYTIGFSTVVFLYGERARAINYVSKYIVKTLDKIGGRYYYHGGAVREPVISYLFHSVHGFDDIRDSFGTFTGDGTFQFSVAGVDYYAQRIMPDFNNFTF